MSLSFYIDRSSWLHSCHPVTKISSLLLAFIPPFLANHPLYLMPYYLVLLMVQMRFGSLMHLRRVLVLKITLFLLSTVLWSFFYQGTTVLFTIGSVGIELESIYYGMGVGIRLNCFLLAALVFLSTTRIEDFTYGLSKMGMPFVASFALTLAFRLTPLFMESAQVITTAQRSRGLDLDTGGPLRRLRKYIPVIIPVLITGLRRADQLAVALEVRGFGVDRPRSALQQYHYALKDFMLILLIVGLILGMSVLRATGHGIV